MQIDYRQEKIDAAEFADILNRSGLGRRRPVGDTGRLQRMMDGASLVVTARRAEDGRLIGVSRALTDGAYACYLSDLAVDAEFQGHGIGTELLSRTRALAGEECMCLLLAAPDAVPFYEKIGMPRNERAFMFPRSK